MEDVPAAEPDAGFLAQFASVANVAQFVRSRQVPGRRKRCTFRLQTGQAFIFVLDAHAFTATLFGLAAPVQTTVEQTLKFCLIDFRHLLDTVRVCHPILV